MTDQGALNPMPTAQVTLSMLLPGLKSHQDVISWLQRVVKWTVFNIANWLVGVPSYDLNCFEVLCNEAIVPVNTKVMVFSFQNFS